MRVLSAFLITAAVLGSCTTKQKMTDTTKTVKTTTIKTPEITDPKLTEVWEPEPAAVTTSVGTAPSDAVVLFDGSDLSNWVHYDGSPAQWVVVDGNVTVKPGTGDIKTKEIYGDVQLHVEWKSPDEPDRTGQDKGNSGVFLQRRYEVQVLNSYQNRTYSNGQAGAIYKQYPPLVNATSPTGQWNTYDIIFHAPIFDGDQMVKKGTLTVLHNGVLIQDHAELQGTTEYIGPPKVVAHGDDHIVLQDHSNEVSYRNIWLRKL